MKLTSTPLAGLVVVEPRLFTDERGYFFESFQDRRYAEVGITDTFVQDNYSRSTRGVLRGMHFQRQSPQSKLVTVIRGRVFDVGVDLRLGSPTFGRWFGAELSDSGPRQMYLPEGFAHGFCVLSEWADVHYKVNRRYDAADEGGVLWSDPGIGIEWPIRDVTVTPRDAAFPPLAGLTASHLPLITPRS